MNRTMLSSVLVLVVLLPGLLFTGGLSLTVSVPTVVPLIGGGAGAVGVSELLFVGLPTAFLVFMVVEATGHIRERKPPS